MAVIEINRNPSRRELAVFGFLMFGFFLLVGAAIYFRLSDRNAAIAIWGLGAVLTAIFAAVPRTRRPIYLVWIYATFPVGWTVSHLVLAAVYYLALTPIGLLMRILGHDPMQTRLDRRCESYWRRRGKSPEPNRYFKQF